MNRKFRIRIACLASLVFAGAAQASTSPALSGANAASTTNVCSTASRATAGGGLNASTAVCVAQFGHCQCCGWENWNGHQVCVHQCCQ
jgi:hypothetical protein